MRKVLLKIMVFCGLLVIAVTALFFLSGRLTLNHRLGTTLIKQERLRNIQGPKMILIGGSNLHYGMNSKSLEDSLGMPVVNMGIQGSLGLRYYFSEVMEQIHEHDIVILLPEPYHFCKVDLDGEQTLFNLISKYPNGLRHLSYRQALNAVFHVGIAIQENLEYLVTLTALKAFNKPTIYEQTNARGDFLGHRNRASIFRPDTTVQAPACQTSDQVITFIRKQMEAIQLKKAHFFIGFAPTATVAANTSGLKAIEDSISSNFPGARLGRIQTYVFPNHFFYNTSHHLLYEYRDQRTDMLLQRYSE